MRQEVKNETRDAGIGQRLRVKTKSKYHGDDMLGDGHVGALKEKWG